ncbi:unnamed protein product [Albugo candida]|uniref:Uncharacterized protein n=1 Tax=Albugo candida TaxID=65357 RepID=A0A024GF89_9STRA|nr:unnamed protein product [Albugo candida]|eukprot:CCI45362.1 unnamed protein product [Albugo candida]
MQAICYSVQSSPRCKIPVNGIICQDDVTEGDVVSLIEMGEFQRFMKCVTWNEGDKELKAVVDNFDLNPNGFGKACTKFVYQFIKNELFISQTFKLPKIPSRPDISEKTPERLILSRNKGSEIWALEIYKIVHGRNVFGEESLTRVTWTNGRRVTNVAHVHFSIRDDNLVPSPYIDYTDDMKQIPFAMRLNTDGLDINMYALGSKGESTLDWTFGYEQLCSRKAQFIKSGDTFLIGLTRNPASQES